MCLLFFLFISTIWSLLQSHYLTGVTDTTYSDQLVQAKQIVTDAQGKQYNLIGKGPNSQYESFIMNYAYLTWWLGHGPAKDRQSVYFIIDDTANGTKIIEKKRSN